MRKNFHKNIGGRVRSTSWQGVSKWYNRLTEGGQGHYYHQRIIIPGVLRLLNLSPNIQYTNPKILDLGCGNGVLAKSLPDKVEYLGVDLSPALIAEARRTDKNPLHKYLVADGTKPLTIPTDFTHATMILSLQNMNNASGVIANTSRHLMTGGALVIILNHPMFRIPRQSSWGIEPGRKIQYRRIDKYLSPMAIPVRMNPSDPMSEETMSYHLPLSEYSKMLNSSGFLIERIEEWTSDKESEGSAARMENRSRSEIPLFMAIVAIKK
jgi:ubiquinone/menaquinone biosynthesis C-methylase UbiE